MHPLLAFEKIIDDSVVINYGYDQLERRYDNHAGGYLYYPVDHDHIRGLLVELWGRLITRTAIAEAFARLTEDGRARNEWPSSCWCEDDEVERPLSDLGAEM
jgi:hypothetical protein